MLTTWTRAEPSHACKESHEIFPREIPLLRKTSFVASYEKDEPSIGLLLGWEYGRLWLKEHKESMEKALKGARPPYIEPDFNWWVNKRSAVIDRRQIFLMKKQNPHVKNCNLSAFSQAKTRRQKRKSNSSANNETSAIGSAPIDAVSMTYSEKCKKCNCKDCKQRRGGGREKKFHLFNESNSIPWY